MLKSTFIHIPGVGTSKEEFLWKNNITTWEDFLASEHSFWPDSTVIAMKEFLTISIKALENQKYEFFSTRLPQKEHWRTYGLFNNICFLDIETTGLSRHRNKITTIGTYDGESSHVFIRGKDMDDFPEFIDKYSTIITFNGKCFDVPFILTKFPQLKLNQFHIDLRFLLAELGYSGGLKQIEQELGVTRDEEVEGVNGLDAVRLWKRYEKGDKSALKKLVAYNLADVINLKSIMEFAYEKKKTNVRYFCKN